GGRHRGAPVVAIGEQDVAADILSGDLEILGHMSQDPDLLAAVERACSLNEDICTLHDFFNDLEALAVLHRSPAAADDTEHLAIGSALHGPLAVDAQI